MTKKTFKEQLRSVFLKLLFTSIVLFFLFLWVCTWTYSEGTRSGNLIKISKKGVVFKSFEGQLNLGGINMAEGLEGNIWSFTVLDETLISSVTPFEGKKVKVYYRERYKTMPWQGDTNYIVTKIEEITTRGL
jgi:hypothetical protein